MRDVDSTAFERDLYITLDSLPIQNPEWNVNEKFDFSVSLLKRLADIHMPVSKMN